MTNLDVTLTLAEYVQRINSVNAADWLPAPADTRIMWNGKRIIDIRVVDICGQISYEVWGEGKFLFADPSETITVSLIPC